LSRFVQGLLDRVPLVVSGRCGAGKACARVPEPRPVSLRLVVILSCIPLFDAAYAAVD